MAVYNLHEIIAQFGASGSIAPYGDGHINDTYRVQGQDTYILQRLNGVVFPNPEQVMQNIALVTAHIQERLRASGNTDPRAVLRIIRTCDGKSFYKTEQGDYFRMFSFIDHAVSYSGHATPSIFYQAAKGFGNFFALLSDFDSAQLYETIKNFHHTPTRYHELLQAVKQDTCGRAASVQNELAFVQQRQQEMSIVTDLLGTDAIPLRVTHNDTKLNNIMLDEDTDAPVCVIDLDTVMPGSILYDFGDSIRFGASSAAEDEQDLAKVSCDMALYTAFTKGFLEETAAFLTEKERQLLPFSARLITLECGMRFLADYLNGDVYFKTHRSGQNLDRARTQFALVADMEKKQEQMAQITADCFVEAMHKKD